MYKVIQGYDFDDETLTQLLEKGYKIQHIVPILTLDGAVANIGFKYRTRKFYCLVKE